MRRFAASMILAAALPFPAAAQVMGDPDVIELLMQDQGLPVERGIEQNRTPYIVSSIDGIRFTIYFHDCRQTCGSLQFISGYETAPHQRVSLRSMNDWNRTQRFSRTYLDRYGDPIIEMDVNLGADGVGRSNFNELLTHWAASLFAFRNHINW